MCMSNNFRIFVSNKIIMNVETKYTDIKNLIGNNVKALVLTPKFYSNKVRGAKEYLNRLHNIFLGVHEENVEGSKYVATIFIQNFFTKEYIREEILIDRYYNVLDVRKTQG